MSRVAVNRSLRHGEFDSHSPHHLGSERNHYFQSIKAGPNLSHTEVDLAEE